MKEDSDVHLFVTCSDSVYLRNDATCVRCWTPP